MGKKSEEKKPDPPKKKGGCVKRLVVLLLVLVMAYFGVHIYFFWQPAGRPDSFGRALMGANVAGFKVFPALRPYPLDHIAGRSDILEGKSIVPPVLKPRLDSAVAGNYPVTFREEEVNAWLSERIEAKQEGLLEPFVKVRGVWVNLTKDEVEIIIERQIKEHTHVSSMFMQFDRSERGYSIRRDSAHIGQVRAPGGFARLIMPTFNHLAAELNEELKPYREGNIRDIRVEDGKITFDPRKPEDR